MSDLMIGASAYPDADVKLMNECGIEWVRRGFPYPWEDRVGGAASERYTKAKEQARSQIERGLKLMGVTPLHGIGTWEAGDDGERRLTWNARSPSYMGEPGSKEFEDNYEAMCAFFADDLKGMVPAWQILNELDIEQFGGPLNPRQACDLVLAAARGLKENDSSLVIGTNTAGAPQAYYLYGYLYKDNAGLLDYCGVDGYFGTWQDGGPRNWDERIAELHALTRTKVFVNEWGFSSYGELMTPEEDASGKHVCVYKKWRKTWGKGHTPEGQADFVREAYEVFRKHREVLLGGFFYRWEDQKECWQCHEPDCPAETRWGLVDLEGKPKPAYYAFKEGVLRLKG